jgi:hypothetical protein
MGEDLQPSARVWVSRTPMAMSAASMERDAMSAALPVMNVP